MSSARARKRFGQHFLKSAEVIDKIIDVVAPQERQTIVEVGPGRGALTGPLLEAGAQVIGVEMERDAAAYLSRTFGRIAGFRLVNEDFLRFDPGNCGLTRFVLVGNLP
ncbi:MAG: rRNA adenine N-6-methyltransferase family protein, partial [Candidatus Zixiibacteriota bacterium]